MDSMILHTTTANLTARTTAREYPGAQRRGTMPAPGPALWGGGRPPRPPKKTALAADGGDAWEPSWLRLLRKEAPGGWDYE